MEFNLEKETENEKHQDDRREIRKILDIFKPIISLSNSSSEINEQPEIKPISVIRLKSKLT